MRKENQKVYKGIVWIVGICSVLILGGRVYEVGKEHKKTTASYTFSLAEVHEADYPTAMANAYFVTLVAERTQGRIQIICYDNGVLGEESEVIGDLQKGNIAFGRISVGPLATYVDMLHMLMLPYLYRDSEHMWQVLESEVGEEMMAALGTAGLTGLAWYESGARNFYFTTPIASKQDFEGKKIRVQKNSLMYMLCEMVGAYPKSLPESEVYVAAWEGSIDGAENNTLTYENYKQYEVCPYYILDEHTRIPDVLVASSTVLKQLSEKDQQVIKEAAKEAGEYERVLWHEREEEALVRLEEKGVTFITLPAELKSWLKETSDSLYDVFGEKYKDILAAIK